MADPFYQCGADFILTGVVCDAEATTLFALQEPVLLLGKVSITGVCSCEKHAPQIERKLAAFSTKGPPTRESLRSGTAGINS